MAEIHVNPTRMELKKLQGKLATAKRGHKLLKDKRDELMKQFLDVVRENKELREAVEKNIMNSHRSITVAASLTSRKMLEEALMLPKKEGSLDVSYRNLMSVNVPVFGFDMRDAEGSGCNYGFAFTSGELDAAVEELAGILPDMIKLAELEKTAQMLAEEIEKTRRRVNALEYIMIPQYAAGIKTIKMKLDENERSNTVRLMKVKNMTIKKELEAKKKSETNE